MELVFTRYEDDLYFAVVRNPERGPGKTHRAKSVASAYRRIRDKWPDANITKVGIVPPDRLGLGEDDED